MYAYRGQGSHWKITNLKLHRYTTVTVISYESQKGSHTNSSEVYNKVRTEDKKITIYYVKSLLVLVQLKTVKVPMTKIYVHTCIYN